MTKLRSLHWRIPLVLSTYAAIGSAVIIILMWFDIVTDSRWIWMGFIALAPFLMMFVQYHQSETHLLVASHDNIQGCPIYQVENAQIDVASRQLHFDKSSEDIQPKAFDLLIYLIENKERVVSKNELLDNVWSDVIVSESSLTQTVKRVRDVFRKHGIEKDIIRNVPRKGYQFDLPVQIATHKPVKFSTNRSSPLSATTITSIISALLLILIWNIEVPTLKKELLESNAATLMVLPFSNLTGDDDFNYFTEGLTEVITSALTREDGLRVIATGSAQQVNQLSDDIISIGEQLGVDYLVVGSVQKQSRQVRISSKLVRVLDGEQIWSEMFSRELDNIFSLHDEIARQVVSKSIGTVAVASQATNNEKHAKDETNSEAFLLVMRADLLTKEGKTAQLKQATNLYRKAINLKPDYPDALAGLANAIRVRATTGDLPRESSFAEALSLATKATELDTHNVNAWIQVAELQHRHFWDFEKAEHSYKKALQVGVSDASAHAAYGRFLSKTGRYKEAVVQAERAFSLDPLSSSAATSLTIRLVRARQLSRAREVLNSFKRRFPNDPNIPWLETNWHIRNKSYPEALQWIALEELDYLRLALTAISLHHLGRTGQAQKTLDELIETDADGAAFQIAEVYAQWHQTNKAFIWLQRAFEQGDPGITELYSSVNLESLYDKPRFYKFANRVGLPDIKLEPVPVTN